MKRGAADRPPLRVDGDHLATFLSDLAATLPSVDPTAGDPDAVTDGTVIQRAVGERHGRQRLRLGWSEHELKRDFEILREELSAAIRRPSTASGRAR